MGEAGAVRQQGDRDGEEGQPPDRHPRARELPGHEVEEAAEGVHLRASAARRRGRRRARPPPARGRSRAAGSRRSAAGSLASEVPARRDVRHQGLAAGEEGDDRVEVVAGAAADPPHQLRPRREVPRGLGGRGWTKRTGRP